MMWLAWTLTVLAGVGATNDVFPPPPDEADAAGETSPTAGAHHLLRHSSRHHRVYNLVLNPEQHSLCEMKHIRQIVTHAHCTSKEMENYVCMGTCFSYTVPQTEPETPGDELLDYCDSCQASESHWTTIQLDCEEYGQAYQVPKNIQMITNCSCSSCNPSRSQTSPSNEVTYPPNDHHVPELLFKMLPKTHMFNEAGMLKAGRELPLTEMSLDELKKNIDVEDPEQLLKAQVFFKNSINFADVDEEEDARNLA